MIESLFAFIYMQVTTNQLLIAGIGTVISGSLIYLTRSIPSAIYLALKRHFSIEFTILSKNENYESILEVLNKNKINFFSRNFSVTENGKNIIPGLGRSFALIRGRFISFERSLIESKMYIEEKTIISIFTRNKNFIQNILDMARKESEKENFIYTQDSTYWDKANSPYSKRLLESVFIDEDIKQKLVKRIEWFYENKQWYLSRGISYKLCICLYGPPGTGKTSLIRALATKFGKDMLYFDNIDSTNSISAAGEKSFLIMEDVNHLLVDKVKSEGEGENKTSQNIQKLLNIIDGIKTPEGMVCIMTTNDINSLPLALKRKGRVDECVFVPPMSKKEVIKMFIAFFGEEHMNILNNLPDDYSVIGSQVQDVFMVSESPEEASKLIHNLYK